MWWEKQKEWIKSMIIDKMKNIENIFEEILSNFEIIFVTKKCLKTSLTWSYVLQNIELNWESSDNYYIDNYDYWLL